ncbi:MAG TPA: methyltransferase domain-containing protein [Candidatus Polarisedimenticolaceae bacterium]|nr:methyltransferase domain-containing protein [Candidatus Polarisedimenticolaceae bacterium]
MRNAALWTSGLVAGTANTLRHRLQGYRRPRRFPNDDYDRAFAHAFEVVDRWQERGRIDPTGRRVLEIGPGSDLGTGAVLLSRGAASYTAVDRFDLASSAPKEFYRRFGNALPEALVFVCDRFPDLPRITGPFDLVVSNATLEHLEDVATLFVRLRQLLVGGGRMVHHVDAKTHMRWFERVDPLNIYRYSDTVYRTLLDFPGAPNRLLAGDYVDAARSAGFRAEVVPGQEASSAYLAATCPGLARRFRARHDLSLLSFTLICS